MYTLLGFVKQLLIYHHNITILSICVYMQWFNENLVEQYENKNSHVLDQNNYAEVTMDESSVSAHSYHILITTSESNILYFISPQNHCLGAAHVTRNRSFVWLGLVQHENHC